MAIAQSRAASALAGSVGVLALSLAAGRANAQFTFVKVADTNTATPAGGTYTGFGVPALSSAGTAFLGLYAGGAGDVGVFTGAGGPLATVVTGGSGAAAQAPGGQVFSGFGNPAVDGGNVAYMGYVSGSPSGSGVFRATGGVQTTIAAFGTPVASGATLSGLTNNVSISGTTVAFAANATGNLGLQSGLFTGSGGALTTIAASGAGIAPQAPGGGGFSQFTNNPTLSGATVAFAQNYVGGNGSVGVFTGSGGALTTVASDVAPSNGAPGGGVFSGLGNPAVSGSNLGFVGYYGAGAFQGIYAGVPGSMARYASTEIGNSAVPGGGDFNFFFDPAVSGGNVAFQGFYSGGTGTNGLFFGSGGNLIRVIAESEALFGSTVTSLSLGNLGLDGSCIAFHYTLANGDSGIALAKTTAPEPGSCLLLALGGAAALRLRRRERREARP